MKFNKICTLSFKTC